MSQDQILNFAENINNVSFTIRSLQPLLALAGYILTALALYTMAERRGIHNPWLAWVPVANLWVLGSLSDQYRYVVRGEYTSRRKSLLILRILTSLLGITEVVLSVSMVVSMIVQSRNVSSADFPITLAIAFACIMLPTIGLAIAGYVVRCIALHDIFKSSDPANANAFLVISIVIGAFISVIPAILLMVCRNRDDGMPPRRDQEVPPPVYSAEYPPM